MNCGHPFSGHENFCPECGQENKGRRITFKNFVSELFSGFFNFDEKFWRTLIPLFIKPGKVSRDYIEGKRQRYTNPFRFYLAVSIIFFLLVGLSKTKERFEELSKNSKTTISKNTDKKDTDTPNLTEKQKTDSIKKLVNTKLQKSQIIIPEEAKTQIINEIEKDSTKSIIEFNLGNRSTHSDRNTRIEKFYKFHKNNPEISIDDSLDSLKTVKNFTNRFLYSRVKLIHSYSKDKESREQFLLQILSYGSVAIFLLLPFFTLFLKFYYLRRKFTYVEHLIFVFHSQTVFFMLFSIVLVIEIIGFQPKIGIFTILFLLYLFIAMKKFYQQGYIKTFVKFILLNLSFLIVASIGVTFLFIFSFALA